MKNHYVDGFKKALKAKEKLRSMDIYSTVAYENWKRYAGLGEVFTDMADFCCGQYDGAVFGVMVNF